MTTNIENNPTKPQAYPSVTIAGLPVIGISEGVCEDLIRAGYDTPDAREKFLRVVLAGAKDETDQKDGSLYSVDVYLHHHLVEQPGPFKIGKGMWAERETYIPDNREGYLLSWTEEDFNFSLERARQFTAAEIEGFAEDLGKFLEERKTRSD